MSLVSSTASASDIQMDYMKLLITQLQNQNPLEPLSNNEMASQLAQFSSLQQLESMSSSFADVLVTINRSYAAGQECYVLCGG
jgi:flagellar basal-body rod modification protein FlgD